MTLVSLIYTQIYTCFCSKVHISEYIYIYYMYYKVDAPLSVTRGMFLSTFKVILAFALRYTSLNIYRDITCRVESGCLSQRDPCHLFVPLQTPPCLPLPRPPIFSFNMIFESINVCYFCISISAIYPSFA